METDTGTSSTWSCDQTTSSLTSALATKQNYASKKEINLFYFYRTLLQEQKISGAKSCTDLEYSGRLKDFLSI